MKRPENVKCGTCVYSARRASECRRHPPAREAHLGAGWPDISPRLWCGEWSDTWPETPAVATTLEMRR